MKKLKLSISLKDIPRKSLIYMGICSAGLLAFYLVAIAPYQRHLGLYDKDIRIIKARIEEQKVLTPVYQDLLRKMQVKDSEVLTIPEEAEFDIDMIDELSAIFGEIARKSNLEPIHFIPDPKSIPKDFSAMMVDAHINGDFLDLRQFLIDLGGVPYLKHIEEIQIKSMDGFKEFRLKLWLILDLEV